MDSTSLSGTGGTATTLLQQAGGAKKAADAKTPAKSDTAGTAAAATGSPAYTISQSMESLLDTLSGDKPSASAGAGANGGGITGDSAGGGAGGGAKALAARAQQAQQIMQSALDRGKELSGMFDKAVDGMKNDLGDLLGSFGMSSDQVSDALGAFGDHAAGQKQNIDFSQLAVNMQQSSSQWSIESRGIDLTLKDGDRSVTISFAKSTLDFQRDDQQIAAQLNADGSGTVGVAIGSTKVTGKATGMIVKSNGFSDEEIKGVLEKLNGMAGKSGGASGLGVLTPTKSADGALHLKLDLAQVLPEMSSQGAAGAAPATPTAANSGKAAAKVDLTA